MLQNPAFRAVFAGVLVLSGASALQASPSNKSSVTAAPTTLPVAAVQSLFHIAKSENRNQVHYTVQVDSACRPIGARPVYGYWREFERGPRVMSGLLDLEQPAYGLLPPRYVQRNAAGGQVGVSLRAFPRRPLVIDVFPIGKQCGARTIVSIDHQSAILTSIYVDIGFLFSVNYALVRGVRLSDGQRVQEKLRPGE
ncbi:MAG: DUF4833 domain-containing protein [Polyangiales bacterium]